MRHLVAAPLRPGLQTWRHVLFVESVAVCGGPASSLVFPSAAGAGSFSQTGGTSSTQPLICFLCSECGSHERRVREQSRAERFHPARLLTVGLENLTFHISKDAELQSSALCLHTGLLFIFLLQQQRALPVFSLASRLLLH